MSIELERTIAVCLNKTPDGQVRCDMPDGTTKYVTEEEYWEKIRPLQVVAAKKQAIVDERQALRQRLAQLEAEENALRDSATT